MSNLISYFQLSDNAFWGTDVFRWWFCLSIIVIIVLERRKMEKRIYGLYPIIFYFALFNPLVYLLTRTFIGEKWQYYARLYSMLPVPYTLALGTILIIEGISELYGNQAQETSDRIKTIIKPALVFTAFALIILGGTNVYRQDWMKKAQNPEKVPNEAIRICNTLHQDEGVTIAVPDTLSSYIRQIDASFYMPYGRYLNEFGEALSQEYPDPVHVMEEAGKEACDYIVVHNNEENIRQFIMKGWEPFSIEGRYIIYKVENVNRTVNQYNSSHQLMTQKTLDAEGKPIQHVYGYYGTKYEYDPDGYRRKETFLDLNDKPAVLSSGYSSIEYAYDHSTKWIISKRYLDEDDQPLNINGRVETRYDYDPRGYVIRERYYDANGEPTNHSKKHFSIRTISRDQEGRIQGESYYDPSAAPAMTSMGYSSYEILRDENGRVIRENYYDTQGEPIGQITDETDTGAELLHFHHSTEGAYETEDGLVFTTSVPNNRINMIHFQLNDAAGGECLKSFGEGYSTGEAAGEYHHQLPDGMYILRLKANASLSDEYIERYVYLTQGDTIRYRYTIDEMEPEQVILKDLSAVVEKAE